MIEDYEKEIESNDNETEWITEIQYKDGNGDNHIWYGNPIVGAWKCNCRTLFPRQLEEMCDKTYWTRSYNIHWSNKEKLPEYEEIEMDEATEHFVCLKCKSNFEYDEEA